MSFRDRLKKTFSRRRSSSSRPSKSSTTSSTSTDPSDRSSSIWYQPGEHIPYKYRRPVEAEHKKKLESFSWSNSWRRRSIQSQVSPMGSRMPSRQGSADVPTIGSNRRRSTDPEGNASRTASNSYYGSAAMDMSGRSELTPIESVPTTRMEPSNPAESSIPAFTQKELDAALKKARKIEAKP